MRGQLVSVRQNDASASEVTKATKHLLKQVEGVPAPVFEKCHEGVGWGPGR